MRIASFKSLLLLCISFEAFAATPDSLFVRGNEKEVDLIPFAHFISTPGEMSPGSAWDQLQHTGKPVVTSSIGFTKDVFWVAVAFKNVTHSTIRNIVEIENPQIDLLRVFRLTQAGMDTLLQSGDALPFKQRHLYSRNFTIPLQLQAKESCTLLFQFDKRNSSLSFPMYLWGVDELYNKDYNSNLGFGIYFGLVLLCAIYAILTYLFLKRQIYLYYFLWIVSSGIFSATHLGFSYQYLYPQWGAFNSIFRVVIEIMTAMSFLTFTRYFLRTKSLLPRIDKILRAINYLFAFLFVLGIALYPFVNSLGIYLMPLLTLIIFVGLVLILTALYQTYHQQRQEVLFYLAAFGAVIAGSLVLLASEIGWLNDRTFTVNPYLVGSAIELVIFSLAITWQIKKIFDERNLLTHQFSNHQQELLRAHIEGIEQERNRIGRELHDNIASRLSNLARMPKGDGNALDLFAQETSKLYQEVRGLSHALASPATQGEGLLPLLGELAYRTSQSSKLRIAIQHYDLPENLSEEIATHVYRVIQEAVENTVKHSNATSADVQLFGRDGELILTYEDNGTNSDFSEWEEGAGLKNIRSRIKHLNGSLEINASNAGMQMFITVACELPGKN